MKTQAWCKHGDKLREALIQNEIRFQPCSLCPTTLSSLSVTIDNVMPCAVLKHFTAYTTEEIFAQK